MSNFRVIGKCKCGYYLLRNEEDGRTFCPICSRTKIGLEKLFKTNSKRLLLSFTSFFKRDLNIATTRFKKFFLRTVKNTNDPYAFSILLKNLSVIDLKDSVWERVADAIGERLIELVKNNKLKEVIDVLFIPEEDKLYFSAQKFLRRIRGKVLEYLFNNDKLIERTVDELRKRGKLKKVLIGNRKLLKKFTENFPEESLKILEKMVRNPFFQGCKEDVQLFGLALYLARRKELLEKGSELFKEYGNIPYGNILRGIAKTDILFLLELLEKHKDLANTFFRQALRDEFYDFIMNEVKIPEDEDKKLRIFEKLTALQETTHSIDELRKDTLCYLFLRLCKEDPSFATYHNLFCRIKTHLKNLLCEIKEKDPLIVFQILEELIDNLEENKTVKLSTIVEWLCSLSFEGSQQTVKLAKKILNIKNGKFDARVLTEALIKTGLPEAYQLVRENKKLYSYVKTLIDPVGGIYDPRQRDAIRNKELHKNLINFLKEDPESLKEAIKEYSRISGFEDFLMLNYVPYLDSVKISITFPDPRIYTEVTFVTWNCKSWYDVLREHNFGGKNVKTIDEYLSAVIDNCRYFFDKSKPWSHPFLFELSKGEKEKIKEFIVETAKYLCDVVRNFRSVDYNMSIVSFLKLSSTFNATYKKLLEKQYPFSNKEKEMCNEIIEKIENFINTFVTLVPTQMLTTLIEELGPSLGKEFYELAIRKRPETVFSSNEKVLKHFLMFLIPSGTFFRINPVEAYRRLRAMMGDEKALTTILEVLPERKIGNSKVLWSREEFINQLKGKEREIVEKIKIPYIPKTFKDFLEDHGFDFFEAIKIERKFSNILHPQKFSIKHDNIHGTYILFSNNKILTLEEDKGEKNLVPIRSLYQKKKRYEHTLRKFFEECMSLVRTLVNIFGSKNIYTWIGYSDATHKKPEMILKVRGKPIFFKIRYI